MKDLLVIEGGQPVLMPIVGFEMASHLHTYVYAGVTTNNARGVPELEKADHRVVVTIPECAFMAARTKILFDLASGIGDPKNAILDQNFIDKLEREYQERDGLFAGYEAPSSSGQNDIAFVVVPDDLTPIVK